MRGCSFDAREHSLTAGVAGLCDAQDAERLLKRVRSWRRLNKGARLVPVRFGVADGHRGPVGHSSGSSFREIQASVNAPEVVIAGWSCGDGLR